MKRTTIFILLQFVVSSLFAQHGIHEEYYFPHKNGQSTKIYRNLDSVQMFHCDAGGTSFCYLTVSNKIVNMYTDSGKIIYKLEIIDSAYLKKYADRKYSIEIFKIIDSNRISFVYEAFFTKKQDLYNFVDTIDIDNKFGITYFTKKYYDSFSSLKTISTKKEVNEITSLFKTYKYLRIVHLYEAAKITDMYGTAIISELLNLGCLEKGFNPLGASKQIDQIMKN